MTEKEFETIEAMQKYGGGFVKTLAICFLTADFDNFEKLKNAFPEYWERYEEMAEKK